MNLARPLFWSFTFATLTLFGCKKDDDTPEPAPAPAQVDVSVNFWFKKGSVTYQLSDLLYDENNRYVELDKVRLIFSNFRQLDDNNNVVTTFPGVIVVADVDDGVSGSSHYLGKAPEGQFRKLAFDIGLDPTTNAMAPSQFSGPPLSDPTLFVNSTQGHRFVTLEGLVDSNGDLFLNGNDESVTYQAVTDAALRHVEFFANTYAAGSVSTIQVPIQMSNIFNGIDLAATPTSIGAGAPIVQLLSNVQAAIGG